MRTNFTKRQLTQPLNRLANEVLRKCVHCGFCTATCPTFLITGDELDSPRGRIVMIQNMLESGKPPKASLVKNLDRCLTCRSCMTTCPSGVDYAQLIDGARAHVEETHVRQLGERLLRGLLTRLLPNPSLFRLAMLGGKLAKPLQGLLPRRLAGMVGMAQHRTLENTDRNRPRTVSPEGTKVMRVALFVGCVQQVLRPAINEATIRLLVRHGCEVVVVGGQGCCGAMAHHMGRMERAREQALVNLRAFAAEVDKGGLDAIIFNASGCGLSLIEYNRLFADDPEWAEVAKRFSQLCRDVCQVMGDLKLAPSVLSNALPVAYHSACTMRHGLKLIDEPKRLLEKAGFTVRDPVESHVCCGSAGTYSLLQPELSTLLLERKVANLEKLEAGVIATGNIGCLDHIAGGTALPVVHTAELLDWATGGPKPSNL